MKVSGLQPLFVMLKHRHGHARRLRRIAAADRRAGGRVTERHALGVLSTSLPLSPPTEWKETPQGDCLT